MTHNHIFAVCLLYSYSLCVQNLPFGGSTSALTIGQATFLHAANWENGQTGLYVLRQAPGSGTRPSLSSQSRPVSAIDPSNLEGSSGSDNSLGQVKRPRSAPVGPASTSGSFDANHLNVVLESSSSHSSLADSLLDGALERSGPACIAAANPTVRACSGHCLTLSASYYSPVPNSNSFLKTGFVVACLSRSHRE
jgi:hypothetical protein